MLCQDWSSGLERRTLWSVNQNYFTSLSFHPHSDGLLYGVCQYEIDHEKLVSPVEYSVTPGVRSVSVSWSTCDTCPG